MLVSYNWLKEYLGGEVPEPEKIAEVLSAKSFEVESIEKKPADVSSGVAKDDFIFDIDVLPNRSHDCLCHTGIAKEIAINFDLDFKYPSPEKTEGGFETNFDVNIEDKNCKRYMLREIKNIEVGESPKGLKDKLESIGEKSINNVVDITNIVMFELGQPMHAFDKDKLEGEKINIRLSKDGEKITTLDKKEVEFEDGTLLIADSEPLAIAGIKGGNKAEVDSNTTNLILESANFVASYIRKSSNKTNIKTDSSKRFENDITPELAETAIHRATELLIKYGGDKVEVSNIVNVYPRPLKGKYKVGLTTEKIEKILGVKISEKEIEEILNKLGIDFKKVNPKKEAVELIKTFEGVPYKYGASVSFDSPESFDCSSLISFTYSQNGFQIPRMAIDQFVFGKEIAKNDLEPGDLVFANQHIVNSESQKKFEGTDLEKMIESEHLVSKEFLPGTKIEKALDHNGMYLGDGKIIHCTSIDNKGVIIEDLESSEHFKDVIGYRRIIEKDDERYVLEVPDLRIDLRKEIDIIEEIGRIYGYDKIDPKPLDFKTEIKENKEHKSILKIKSELQKLGFSEVVTYSFNKKGDLRAIKALASDKQYLRKSLEKGMLGSLDLNHYNADLIGVDTIKIFEIGKIYPKGEPADTDSGVVKEKLVLGLAVRNKNFKKPKTGEIISDTLEKIGFKVDVKEMDEFAQVELDVDNLDSSGSEIDFDNTVQVEKLSSFPFVSRDISVWIPDGEGDENTIFEIVENHAGELLKNKRLMDEFPKEERTSYSVRVVFQSDEKTLTDDEIGKIMDAVYKDLGSKEGFEIR
jgi:phenylalanyl-tRNA synthetase beta subunit